MSRILVSACLLGEAVRYDGRAKALGDAPLLRRHGIAVEPRSNSPPRSGGCNLEAIERDRENRGEGETGIARAQQPLLAPQDLSDPVNVGRDQLASAPPGIEFGDEVIDVFLLL